MERKEIIKCLEHIRLEETLFQREKERKALSAAVRKMKYDPLKRMVIILAIAVLVMTAAWAGIGIGSAEMKGKPMAPISDTQEAYSYEGMEEGDIRITTNSDNFIRLSNHTIIITDKTLPEVEKEIRLVKILERERQ